MNQLLKYCAGCNTEKEKWEFSWNVKSLRSTCKKCRSNEQNAKQKANPEVTSKNRKDYYDENKSRVRSVQLQYRQLNTDEIKQNKKEYYQLNKDKIKVWNEQHKARRNQRIKERRESDPVFRISQTLRARLHDVLKDGKSLTSNRYIGISGAKLIEWLQFQMEPDMTWENYGSKWVIDHTVPIAAFDLVEHSKQLICFHWTNLRPMQKNLNEVKSSKIHLRDIFDHIETTKRFINISGYQITPERVWWLGEDPRYGNNPEDEVEILNRLKSAIRSQVPKFERTRERFND